MDFAFALALALASVPAIADFMFDLAGVDAIDEINVLDGDLIAGIPFFSFAVPFFPPFFLVPWVLHGFLPGLGRGGSTHFFDVEMVGTERGTDS